MNATFTHILFFRMVHHATRAPRNPERRDKLASRTLIAQRCLKFLRAKSQIYAIRCNAYGCNSVAAHEDVLQPRALARQGRHGDGVARLGPEGAQDRLGDVAGHVAGLHVPLQPDEDPAVLAGHRRPRHRQHRREIKVTCQLGHPRTWSTAGPRSTSDFEKNTPRLITTGGDSIEVVHLPVEGI